LIDWYIVVVVLRWHVVGVAGWWSDVRRTVADTG